MQMMKRHRIFTVMALAAGFAAISANTNAQERPAEAGPAGPPAWVIAAWENGEAPVAPAMGPPAWVVEAWQNGERPQRPQGAQRPRGSQRPFGPPPWIAARHEMAKELGLSGPPSEVREAWKSGNGFELPGPPNFVLDLFGF